jgi:hypothetical protein
MAVSRLLVRHGYEVIYLGPALPRADPVKMPCQRHGRTPADG